MKAGHENGNAHFLRITTEQVRPLDAADSDIRSVVVQGQDEENGFNAGR